MPKVCLKPNCGNHRLKGGKFATPGEEIEITKTQLEAFPDKFTLVISAEELAKSEAAAAKKEAEEAKAKALAKAKAAEAAAEAAKEAEKKTGAAGKG